MESRQVSAGNCSIKSFITVDAILPRRMSHSTSGPIVGGSRSTTWFNCRLHSRAPHRRRAPGRHTLESATMTQDAFVSGGERACSPVLPRRESRPPTHALLANDEHPRALGSTATNTRCCRGRNRARLLAQAATVGINAASIRTLLTDAEHQAAAL